MDLGLSLDLSKQKRARQYSRMGEIAKERGLVWGGDWKHPEPWHFELPGLNPWNLYFQLAGLLDRLKGLMSSK